MYTRSPLVFGSMVTAFLTSSITASDETNSVGGTEIFVSSPLALNPLKSLNIESFPDMKGVP